METKQEGDIDSATVSSQGRLSRPNLYKMKSLQLGSEDENPDLLEILTQLNLEIDAISDHIYNVKHPGNYYEKVESDKIVSTEGICQRFCRIAGRSGYNIVSKVADNTTSTLARFLWVVIILVSAGLLSLQLWDRITMFLASDTLSITENHMVDAHRFPVVTICNLNTFRMSKLPDETLYQAFQELGDRGNWDENLSPKSSALLSLPYTDLFTVASHIKKDFILRCVFNGRPCSYQDFSDTVTSQGLCFSFVPHPDREEIFTSGPESGLSVVLNVEQYEYVLNGRTPVGASVTLHDRWQLPNVGFQGKNIPVGVHSFFSVSKQTITSSYDEICNSPTATICLESQKKCQNIAVRKKCNCSLNKDDKLEKWPLCTGRQYLMCARKLLDNHGEDSQCHCTPRCRKSVYSPFVSEAGGSVYAAESIVRALHLDRPQIETKYRYAWNLRQRRDRSVFDHDILVLTRMVNDLTNSSSDIKKISQNLLKLYDENKYAISSIKSKLETLNATVHVNVHNFKSSTHVKFHINMENLIGGINTLLLKESSTQISDSIADLQTIMQNILSNLDRIVMSRAFSHFVKNDLLSEITKEVNRFREDLISRDGYGRFYEEFKDSFSFYDIHTKRIINMTNSIRLSLSASYNRLKAKLDLLKNSELSIQEAKTNLAQFFSSLKYTSRTFIKNLQNEIQLLFDKYIGHKDSILRFYKKIQFVLGSIIPKQKSISNVFSQIQGKLTELDTRYKKILKTYAFPVAQYKSGNMAKSKLAQTLLDVELTSEVEITQTVLTGLLAQMNELLTSSDVIDNSVQDLIPRLEGFQLLKAGDSKHFYPRKFNGSAENMRSLVGVLSTSLNQLQLYQNEMLDYTKAGHINSKFYLNNFLQLNVYFKDMTESVVSTKSSYSLIELACDIGGTLALYFGASLLTFVGIADVIVRTLCCSTHYKN